MNTSALQDIAHVAHDAAGRATTRARGRRRHHAALLAAAIALLAACGGDRLTGPDQAGDEFSPPHRNFQPPDGPVFVPWDEDATDVSGTVPLGELVFVRHDDGGDAIDRIEFDRVGRVAKDYDASDAARVVFARKRAGDR